MPKESKNPPASGTTAVASLHPSNEEKSITSTVNLHTPLESLDVSGTANFVAVGPFVPLGPTGPKGAPGVTGTLHFQNADMASMPGGLQYTEHNGNIDNCLIGDYPLNGTFTMPGLTLDWPNHTGVGRVYPNQGYFPQPSDYTTTVVTPNPLYWGVQQKTVAEKDCPEYWVVNPLTLTSLTRTAKIVARCETENDARFLCRLLNESQPATDKAKAPKDGGPLLEKALKLVYTPLKAEMQNLEGRVLTIVDATIAPESQNKAMKSLMRKEFSTTLTATHQFCHPNAQQAHGDS